MARRLLILIVLAIGCDRNASPPSISPTLGREKISGEADTHDAVSLFNRGGEWLDKGQPDKAIQDFSNCIRLDPTNSNAFVSRGIAWTLKQEHDKAIQDYDEAIRIHPKDTLAFFNRGVSWWHKKEYYRAIRDYDDAIRLGPENPFFWSCRGFAWAHMQEYDKAIRDYDEAIRLDPKHVLAFRYRGIAWRDKQEYDKATFDLDEAIRLDPNDSSAFSSRGLTWWHKKMYDKATIDLEEAFRLDSAKQAQPLILGYFAASRANDEKTAKRFLKYPVLGVDETTWPFPVIRFLRHEIDEQALLNLATDEERLTEARCYLGLDHALEGRKVEAVNHFRWVEKHGATGFYAYRIAVAELEGAEK